MATDFVSVKNTIVVSDIHLADAEPPHPRSPLWKAYKRPEHFVDGAFRAFIDHLLGSLDGEAELILNGDIFDFDSVMAIPRDPQFHVSWLERLRGLFAEEEKSRYKLKVIHRDHPEWFAAVREFVMRGNRVVFIFGNHDAELHWPSVRKDLVEMLELPEGAHERVRFCEWFYVSNGDTLIEHGAQYDAYSLCSNPINPLIRKGHRNFVRIPFGDLAGKFLLNGMGLMNPHAPSTFIRGSLWGYLQFYYRYVLRSQPLLVWTWFWGAIVTLVYSVNDGFLPALSDPLTVDSRVNDIAQRANSSSKVVWSLKELHVHPAIFNPIKIMRELWLDRALLLGALIGGSFLFFSALNVFVTVSLWWFVVPLLLLMPGFLFYARSVNSEMDEAQKNAYHVTPLSARIAGVARVVHGHTHLEGHHQIEGVEYLNTGSWSPAYHDVECTKPHGRKCFAWIRPGEAGRVSELYEWKTAGPVRIPVEPLNLEDQKIVYGHRS